MAIKTVLDVSRLDSGWILAPERYDPRRQHTEHDGPRLSDYVKILREQVNTANANEQQQFLVVNTGDASNGIIRPRNSPCGVASIRSTKKRVYPGQVIISRLRPYLRQVAWVDTGLLEPEFPSLELLCSTEFFVLDSKDGKSIAFLVPFLLTSHIQTVLAASQEGGHHPRFNEYTLTTLPIPLPLLEQRAELSAQVEHAVNQMRKAFKLLEYSIESVPKTEPVAAAEAAAIKLVRSAN